MPIRVYSWSKPSVCVHRAICQHFNLDFDDEVHTAVISSVVAIEEINSLMQKNPLFNKFLDKAVLDITSEMTANIGRRTKLRGYSIVMVNPSVHMFVNMRDISLRKRCYKHTHLLPYSPFLNFIEEV
jgi:hypothetical protein